MYINVCVYAYTYMYIYIYIYIYVYKCMCICKYIYIGTPVEFYVCCIVHDTSYAHLEIWDISSFPFSFLFHIQSKAPAYTYTRYVVLHSNTPADPAAALLFLTLLKVCWVSETALVPFWLVAFWDDMKSIVYKYTYVYVYVITICHSWVLQCVTVCCSALQCVAVCCSVLQCGTVRCSVLQCVTVFCSVLEEKHHHHFATFSLCHCCCKCVPSQHLHLKVRRVLLVSARHGPSMFATWPIHDIVISVAILVEWPL